MSPNIQNYRVLEVSQKLGVSKSTIWNYIKEGRLKSKKLSPRVTIIEAKELERFMETPYPSK